MAQITLPLSEVKRSRILLRLEASVRRAIDVLASFFGLILLSPVFIWITILQHRDSPGPTFFRGKRLGIHGRTFDIVKFRTMYETKESYQGSPVTGKGDSRITPFGAWLRTTKLNELPQLWNVLKGDMSLVGPRPEMPDLAAEWPSEVRRELLAVRPGITSPASVFYRDEENLLRADSVVEDYLTSILPSKIRLDLLYIRNRSILTDLDVIFWTLWVVMPMLKRLPIPKQLLYWGPLSVFVNRYLSWMFIDTLIAFSAIGIAGAIWRTTGPLNLGLEIAIPVALGFSLIFSLFNWMLGLGRVEWSRAPSSEAAVLAFSCLLAASVTYLVNLSLNLNMPIGLFIVSALLALVGFVTFRYRDRLITGLAGRWIKLRGGVREIGERVLVIGAGENGALASWLFSNSYFREAFTMIGMVDDNPRMRGMELGGYKVLGATEQIPDIVKKFDVGILLFTIDNIARDDRHRILEICRQTNARLILLPDAIQPLRAQLRLAHNLNQNGRAYPNVQKPISFSDSSRQLSHSEVDAWLNELGALAECGEYDILRARLAEIRSTLRD